MPGSAECNAARSQIVTSLGDTAKSVGQIQDPTVKQAATTGLTQAKAGIQQIGQALQSGSPPPAAGRTQVEAGLTATNKALAGGNA